MLILDKLWNGELDPAGRKICIAGFSERRREVSETEARLLALLTPEGKDRLEAYNTALLSMATDLERDAFFTGFRTAGLLMLDILQGM